MIRGGYKIIDLKNKELTSGVGMVFEGIYDAIEETTKPIILPGLNVNGTEYPDRFLEIYKNGSNYEIDYAVTSGESVYITITDTDVVTAAV